MSGTKIFVLPTLANPQALHSIEELRAALDQANDELMRFGSMSAAVMERLDAADELFRIFRQLIDAHREGRHDWVTAALDQWTAHADAMLAQVHASRTQAH